MSKVLDCNIDPPCKAARPNQIMLFLDCSVTQPKRLASLAASNSAQEIDDDQAAAEATQAALDVDINQLQVYSGCNKFTLAVEATNYRYILAATSLHLQLKQQMCNSNLKPAPYDHKAHAAYTVLADAPASTFTVMPMQGMGFSKSKAKEALQENNHDLEAAIEWLVANCI